MAWRSRNIKVAILISMVAEVLQEKILEIEKGMTNIKYGTAREVVITTALRKAEQRKPNDMDVGAVEKQQQEEEGAKWAREMESQGGEEWWWNQWGEVEYPEVDIGAVVVRERGSQYQVP